MSSRLKTLTSAALLTVASMAHAQFEPSPERLFGFIDRDRNGVIDRKELESAPGPFRDALGKHPSLDRGITQRDFDQVAPKLMEDFRRRRDDENRDRDRERERERDREREKEREREREREREMQRSASNAPSDNRSSSGSSSSSSKPKKPVPKQRITMDLPRAFQAIDINGDDQISLFEWDRAKYADFQTADRNGDGILTAKEILAAKISPAPAKTPAGATTTPSATSKPSTSTTGSTVASSSSPTKSATAASTPSSSAPGKPIEPTKVEADSSEGRMSKYIFGRLDLDKDGSLTDAEWSKSESVRKSFEKVGAKMPLPIKADDFSGWHVAVQKAERSK